jgi:hypothetical protein
MRRSRHERRCQSARDQISNSPLSHPAVLLFVPCRLFAPRPEFFVRLGLSEASAGWGNVI